MEALKLLDVTLRDGGHLNNFHFDDFQLETILNAIEQSGVDLIEVGYKNGSISPIDNIGVAGLCPPEYLQQCKQYLKKTKMAIMAHCHNINAVDIKALKKSGVYLLRLCLPKGEHAQAYPLLKIAKEEGLKVSLNFIHISQYRASDFYQIVEQVIHHNPDMIYLADSNGCMHPNRITDIFKTCLDRFDVDFGFHAHDNIGLAQTNALAAHLAGAKYIDASLAGVGKGIGNLRLEYFIAYLHSMKDSRYDLTPLIDASNAVRRSLDKVGFVSSGEFTRGIKDLSTKQLAQHLAKES